MMKSWPKMYMALIRSHHWASSPNGPPIKAESRKNLCSPMPDMYRRIYKKKNMDDITKYNKLNKKNNEKAFAFASVVVPFFAFFHTGYASVVIL